MTSSTMVSLGPNAQLGFTGARHLVPDRLPSASGDRAVVLRALYMDDDVKLNIRRMAAHLRQVDFSDLDLAKLDPALVENLVELQSLNVSNNRLDDSSIPSAVGKLSRLVEFVGHDNNFTKIPNALSKLKHLKRLMIANNRVDSLDGLEKLHALQLFVADDNRIRELPRDIWQNVRQMEVLKLARNRIDSLGTGMRQLKHLREVDVSGNRLTSLPAELFVLPNLESLNAAANRISRLPTVDARRMKSRPIKCAFDFSDNQITSFPDYLLHGAERLDISNNNIRRLPLDALAQLQQCGLTRLNLSGNQIADPPQAVCDGGITALLQHMEETKISRKVFYGLKVLVFGPPGSGKTSLIWSMMDEESRLTMDDEETSGVELYDVSRPIRLGPSPSAAAPVQSSISFNGSSSSSANSDASDEGPAAADERALLMNVWDFSWKRNDLVIHRHFLHGTSLILLVYDVSRIDAVSFAAELGASLNWLLTCAGDFTLLPVGSRRDLVKQNVDDVTLTQQVDAIIGQHTKKRLDRIRKEVEEIEAKTHLSSAMTEQLKTYRKLLAANVTIYPTIVVSSKTMSGVDDLLKKIDNIVLAREKFPNVLFPVPAMWVEIERYLEEKCANSITPVVPGESLRAEIGKRFNMKHLIQQVFQYLIDTGKILSISGYPSHKELIILKPTWFLDITRAVFRDKFDFENDYQLEQTLKAFGATAEQFQELLYFMHEHGTLEQAYLQCVWENSLPHRDDVEKYEHCERTLLTILSDYFEIAYIPPRGPSAVVTEKPVVQQQQPRSRRTSTNERPSVSEQQQPRSRRTSTADRPSSLSEQQPTGNSAVDGSSSRNRSGKRVKKKSTSSIGSKRSTASAKTSSTRSVSAIDGRTTVNEGGVTNGGSAEHSAQPDIANNAQHNGQNGDSSLTAQQSASTDDQLRHRLYVPLFFGQPVTDAFRDMYSRFVGNVGIAAVFSFPYYHPPGVFETMIVRSQSGKHALQLDFHWEDGVYGRCLDLPARFCLTRIVHADGVACFRVEVRHETSTDGEDEVKALWRVMLLYLRDVEALLQTYPGLYVERFVECPQCTSLSFSGEWQTPKELQSVASKTCEDCGADVSTSLLIQTKEKKKIEEFLRLRLMEKSRKRSTVEAPSTAAVNQDSAPPTPISSEAEED